MVMRNAGTPAPSGCRAPGEHGASWRISEATPRAWCARCEPPPHACPHCGACDWWPLPEMTLSGDERPQGYACRICHPAWWDREARARKHVDITRDTRDERES